MIKVKMSVNSSVSDEIVKCITDNYDNWDDKIRDSFMGDLYSKKIDWEEVDKSLNKHFKIAE